MPHTFVEINHEIFSTPSADSRRVVFNQWRIQRGFNRTTLLDQIILFHGDFAKIEVKLTKLTAFGKFEPLSRNLTAAPVGYKQKYVCEVLVNRMPKSKCG